jgi:ankyrin repeat protein
MPAEDADPLFDAAERGDVDRVRAIIDEDPARLNARKPPYEWTLLHSAAANGRAALVNLLLERGLDPNTREKGDDTYAMHWAAAAGHADIVRRLAEAGGDVTGAGDDHALEIIGWATCWDGCDDDAHRAVVDVLLAHGARHNIYSAMATHDANELRRVVAENPAALTQPRSEHEGFQQPLHFAVSKNLGDMVALLLELGADPLATDGEGFPVMMYATRPDIDRPVLEAIRARGAADLAVLLAMHDWNAAAVVAASDSGTIERAGALHFMAKRGDVAAVNWLLQHGANPDARWNHWNAMVTPLHLATLFDHSDVARALLAAGADPTIRDSLHDSDAIGWAEFFGRIELVALYRSRGNPRES